MGQFNFKTKPYEHQLKALKSSWDKQYYAFFMEMGTGKSKVLIDEIAALYLRGRISNALIIAPKGVYRNWERSEIPTHLSEDVPNKVVTWRAPSNMTKKDKESLKNILEPNGKLRIVLMNIEALSGDTAVKYASKFLKTGKSMVAIDESTTIKTHTARRTKNAMKISELATYRRIMTGSPVTKNPLDLYSQLNFLWSHNL
jgi:SNF2 family DNA or RNA helicase